MPNDAPGRSDLNPQFKARLDAVFAKWDVQLLKELRAVYARTPRRPGAYARPPLEVLKVELHKIELESAHLRDEIARASRAAADWEHKATRALDENREDLARDAVIKCAEYADTMTELSLDAEVLEATAAELRRLVVYFQRRDRPDATASP